MQVGIDTLIFVLLALGLNVAVGWVGLLDLGYVAFFGIGAYLYAALASEYAGRHWDAAIAIPLIAVAAAVAGFLVGLPSRRLVGDYLAIVTLFFLQLWLVDPRQRLVVTRAERHLGHRSSHVLRAPDHVARRLVLRRTRRLRPHHLVPVPPESVAHRSRVARTSRGRARGRAHDDARGPAEADGVRRRRGRRRRRRGDLRAGAGRDLPGELRPRPADHGVRDGRSRRSGQPGRRHGRRRAHQRVRWRRCETPKMRAGSSTGSS